MAKKVSKEDIVKLTNPINEKRKIGVSISSYGPTTFSPNIAGSGINRNVTVGRKATKDNRFVNNKDFGNIGGGIR
jgi:hypothetical protein